MNIMRFRPLIPTFAMLAACHRPARQPDSTPLESAPAQAASASAAQDTARGIVAVVGTDRFNRVILKQPSGASGVALVGDQASTIANVAGADVWAAGTRLPNGDLQVSRFVVRAVDGAPATDGTLELSGAQYYIVSADSVRLAVNNVPDALRRHVGKRVWATGQLAQGPVTFGVIAAPKSNR